MTAFRASNGTPPTSPSTRSTSSGAMTAFRASNGTFGGRRRAMEVSVR